MGFKQTPYDAKVRRETALLLHLGELTVKEVLEHYALDESYRNKLYVWCSRAKTQYEEMDTIQQETARKEALERFYGKIPAAARLDMLKPDTEPQEALNEILEDTTIAAFIQDTPEVLPAEESVPNTPLQQDSTHSLMDIDSCTPSPLPVPCTPEAYDNSMQDIKGNGIKSVENELKTLQNLTPSILTNEINFLSRVFKHLESANLADLKPRDIKTLAEAAEKLITLRRKALLLPFGHLDPNAKPTVNVSKQLHFHNHGLQGFDPNK